MGKKKLKSECKDKSREVKNNFELDIVNLIKKGLNPAKIAVKLNISMPNLSYYLSSLKKQGVIKKLGYGVWQVISSGEVKMLSHKGSLQVKDVRGHAFIWKIKPRKKINWIEVLEKQNIKYEVKGLAKTPRIILNGKKIWLGKTNITIFEPKWNSFFATNPIEAKKEAVFDMLKVVDSIKELAGEFKYTFTCRRQHYGFLNSPEAKDFIRRGKKVLIKNEKGYWFSIDHSQNKYVEAETIHEQDADIDGIGYQNLMNSHERTNFKVTPDFTIDALNKLIAAQAESQIQLQEYAKQNKEHLALIQEYRKENIAWRKNTKEIYEKNSSKISNNQTKLGKFL